MSKEELIEHYKILYEKEIEKLKSFKDGDFFKIISNNEIIRWGCFKKFEVTVSGIIISTHLNYNYSHKGFETKEGYFFLGFSESIEKIKSTELLVFMLKLKEQNFTFDRRNKMLIDNSIEYL